MFRYAALVSIFALIIPASQGCGSGGSSGTFTAPSVATLVKASLPAGLKPGGTASVVPAVMLNLRAKADREALQGIDPAVVSSFSTTPSNLRASLAAGYIINLFQDTYSDVQGFLMSKVATIDSRMSLFNGAPLTGCLAQTPAPFKIDLSAIDPILNFTLKNIQCYAPFGNPPAAGSQSGEAFGQSGANSSLWVQPSDNFSTSGGFLGYANVLNAGSTSATAPEQVDGLTVDFGPNSPATGHNGGTMNITRYIATTTTKTFEMYYGGSQGSIGTASSNNTSFIGVGFRMISDGALIYADGTLCDDPTGGTCKDNVPHWPTFNVCLDAATVAVHSPASDCTTLANSFTLNNTTASLTFTEITGDTDVSHSYGYLGTTNFGPTVANVNLVTPFGNISQFTSIAGKYGQ